MSDRYRQALDAYGLEDLQPLYRRLLVRLKSANAAAYEEAVARYRSDVEAVVDDADDPVALWIGYGAWLAPRLAPGELMTVDENGRARSAESPPPLGTMLMHLPGDRKHPAILLAMPADPSPAQRETAELLCGRS